MIRIKFLLFSLLFLASSANCQNKQEIENLKTFAKVYGYVKYFHPSDEASKIDWGKFAIYGAKEVEKCKTSEELLLTLNNLFLPIAPSIKLYQKKNKEPFDISSITPANFEKYKKTYWQHVGLGKATKTGNTKQSPYKSIRVNRTETIIDLSSFGNIMSLIPAANYIGKEIKFSGMVKVKDSFFGTGHLWLRIDKSDETAGFFDNMDNNPIVENKWNKYEIVGKIDSLATSIVFGCFLDGDGELLVDNLQLCYKNNKEWIEIPVKNNNFETEAISKKLAKTQWIFRGKDYSIKLNKNDVYEGKKSILIKYVGKAKKIRGKKLFEDYPKVDEVINKEIGNGLACYIPLTLYCSKNGTYPQGDINQLYSLVRNVKGVNPSQTELSLRHGNIVNVWNVFQHFYPYFDVVDVDWNLELEKALLKCYFDKDRLDFKYTLEEFTAPLKDGHIGIYGEGPYYVLPIEWEWVESKLIITEVFNNNIPLKRGDIITKINNQLPEVYFKSIENRTSAGTDGYLKYRASITSLFGEKDSEIVVEVNNNMIELTRNIHYYDKNKPPSEKELKPSFKFIGDDIIYLNIDKIEENTIDSLLPKLETSKAIICDLRGYPNGNHNFIKYLMTTKDTANQWMQIPQFIYPDQEKVVGYEKHNWIHWWFGMRPKKPHLNAKIIFIIDGQAISYAESFMGFIEGYKLATIIGQPTAGTNGNINPFSLPGYYEISFTGMKVLKHDGSQLHGIGILPDIYLNKTIKGVSEGRDEFLEKAIEIANKN